MALANWEAVHDRYVVSKQVTYADDGANVVYQVPANTLVRDVTLVITTLFAGTSPTVDVGDADNDDGWVDNGDVTETTAGSYIGTNGNGATIVPHGKWYAAATNIIITIGGTDLTAGAVHAVIHELPMGDLV